MEIKPIKTRRDYEVALKLIEGLMSAKAKSAEGDRLDVLVTLVQAYEARPTASTRSFRANATLR